MSLSIQINCESFNYYIFKLLKEFQYTWGCYNIFPDEIITKIMITLAYVSIHPNNILYCDDIECVENWNMIMRYKKLDEDQGVIHCDGSQYDSDIDDDVYCHKIVLKNVDRYKCGYCYKTVCESCIYQYEDVITSIDDTDVNGDPIDLQLICFSCIPLMYPGLIDNKII